MDITDITRHVLATRFPGRLAKDINYGLCHKFAEYVLREVNEEGFAASAIWGCDTDPGLDALGCHCFVIHEGRYYDSEALDGVDDPYDLPFYKRMAKEKESSYGMRTLREPCS